jgi:hypothetical protein
MNSRADAEQRLGRTVWIGFEHTPAQRLTTRQSSPGAKASFRNPARIQGFLAINLLSAASSTRASPVAETRIH